MQFTKAQSHGRWLSLGTQVWHLPVLAHVLMQGPQGQRLWWELFWSRQQIGFRNLANFTQQGTTGIPCLDPGQAMTVIRSVWLDPTHQLGLGAAWEVLANENRIRAGVHHVVLPTLPYGAVDEACHLASLASMPLPDGRHSFWQQLW